jgi:hypothetical protein
MVIRFFCIHQSHKNRTAPTRGLSNGHDAQETIEALQTAFRWKIPFLLHTGHFSFVQTPQNGAVVLTGLTPMMVTRKSHGGSVSGWESSHNEHGPPAKWIRSGPFVFYTDLNRNTRCKVTNTKTFLLLIETWRKTVTASELTTQISPYTAWMGFQIVNLPCTIASESQVDSEWLHRSTQIG